MPPPDTATVPVVAVAAPVANTPVTVMSCASAKALPVFSAPDTMRFLPASVLPVAAVAVQLAVEKVGGPTTLPATVRSPESDFSKPLTTTFPAFTARVPALVRSTVPPTVTDPKALVVSSVILPLALRVI